MCQRWKGEFSQLVVTKPIVSPRLFFETFLAVPLPVQKNESRTCLSCSPINFFFTNQISFVPSFQVHDLSTYDNLPGAMPEPVAPIAKVIATPMAGPIPRSHACDCTLQGLATDSATHRPRLREWKSHVQHAIVSSSQAPVGHHAGHQQAQGTSLQCPSLTLRKLRRGRARAGRVSDAHPVNEKFYYDISCTMSNISCSIMHY